MLVDGWGHGEQCCGACNGKVVSRPGRTVARWYNYTDPFSKTTEWGQLCAHCLTDRWHSMNKSYDPELQEFHAVVNHAAWKRRLFDALIRARQRLDRSAAHVDEAHFDEAHFELAGPVWGLGGGWIDTPTEPSTAVDQ